jgi:hypothetical protein
VGQSPNYELKATGLTPTQKNFFAEQAKQLLIKNPNIKIFAITVKKTKVLPHIRQDPNKLYNYMLGLLLPGRVKAYQFVTLIPDKRSIKVKSGNSLVDYLQIKLWFELKSKTKIEVIPTESSKAKNIQFVDFICNIVWNNYERNHATPYNILKPRIKSTRLFF